MPEHHVSLRHGAVRFSPLGARRARATAYALLVAGSIGGIAAANAVWRRQTGDLGQQVTRTGVEVTGTLALMLTGALAAGTLLLLTLRSRGRRLLTVPLAIIAIGMVMGGVAQVGEPGATWLPIGYSVAGLVGFAGVVVTGLTAHYWPQPPDRFARRAGRAATVAGDDPAEVWKAMDDGFDPTDGAAEPDRTAEDARSAGKGSADQTQCAPDDSDPEEER